MIDIPTKSLVLIVDALGFYIENNISALGNYEHRQEAERLKKDIQEVINRSSSDR